MAEAAFEKAQSPLLVQIAQCFLDGTCSKEEMLARKAAQTHNRRMWSTILDLVGCERGRVMPKAAPGTPSGRPASGTPSGVNNGGKDAKAAASA